MSQTALRIIDDFLTASDAKIRCKGVLALRALESADAAARLVRVALTDTDPVTRDQAEGSIAALESSQTALMDHALQEHLDEKEYERSTYALLGRLRLQGRHSEISLGSLGARLRRALGLFSELKRDQGWRFWVRGFWPALQGVILGFFFLIGLGLLGIEFSDFYWVELDSIALVLLFIWLVALRTTPTALHFDRIAGVAVDVLFGSAIALMILCSLLALFAAERLHAFDDALAILLMIGVARVVVAVTRGSIAIPFVGAFVRVCAAAFAGIFSAGILLGGWSMVTQVDLDDIDVWPLYWLLGFGFARSFVALDQLPKKRLGALDRIQNKPLVDPLASWKLPPIVLASIGGLTLALLAGVVLVPADEQAAQAIEPRLGDSAVAERVYPSTHTLQVGS